MRTLSRIFFLLLVACIGLQQQVQGQSILDPADPVITYNSATPPTQPVWGDIGKWVRKVRLSWNTTAYKAYIYKGVAFRLKFPKTYNPAAADGKRYPMLAFLHGLGETGPIYDNEFQLYHGGQFFMNSVNNGNFDGYILAIQSQGFFGATHYQYITEIINYMIVNNKLDPFQVSANGLSAGGQGTWEFLTNHPTYISAALPMSWTSVGYKEPAVVNTVKYTPIWLFQGGLDGSPAPSTTHQVRDAILAAGGNLKYTEYPKLGHGTWNQAWSEPDFFPFIKRAYASNPWTLTGRTEFCPGDPITATLGLQQGFAAYEWRKDGILLPGATTNLLTINEIGVYSARIQMNGVWSDWSRTPVQIKIKTPTVSPAITVSGLASRVLPALDGSTAVKLEVPADFVSYIWQKEGSTATLSTSRYLDASVGSYKIKVTEKFGCSSNFSELFTVINANGPNKPDAATNLIVSTLSQTALKLDWSDNPTPAFNETNFEIYQASRAGGPYRLVALTNRDVKTYTASGLNANSAHYFKVRAINNTAAAAPSNEAGGTTVADIKAPTAPKDLIINGTTPTSISLTWLASTDDVGVVKYEIYVNGQKTYITTGTVFTVSGLQTGSTNTFVVKALDFAGNVSAGSNQVTGQAVLKGIKYKYYTGVFNALPDFNALMPQASGFMPNIALTPRTQNDNFAFLWEGFIKIPAAGNYRFRTNSDDGSKLYLGALNGAGSPYSFSATAIVNNDGLHGPQDITSAVISLSAGIYPIAISFFEQGGGESMTASWETPGSAGFVLIPNSVFEDGVSAGPANINKPSNLTATAISDKSINLKWTDNSSNETGFEIWRSVNPFTNFITVGQTVANVTNFADSSLSSNIRYYYRIRAVGLTGESPYDKEGQGVDYAYYEQNGLTVLPDFNTLTPVKTGRAKNFALGMQNRTDNFQLKYSGTINIPTSGIYTFYTSSDAGSKLYIDGFDATRLVVNNDGEHLAVEMSGSVNLTKGAHTIYVTFFETTGTES
ncbi:MAG: PA14 domain-containing protein, partial [Chitinophagaceae bacterium]